MVGSSPWLGSRPGRAGRCGIASGLVFAACRRLESPVGTSEAVSATADGVVGQSGGEGGQGAAGKIRRAARREEDLLGVGRVLTPRQSWAGPSWRRRECRPPEMASGRGV